MNTADAKWFNDRYQEIVKANPKISDEAAFAQAKAELDAKVGKAGRLAPAGAPTSTVALSDRLEKEVAGQQVPPYKEVPRYNPSEDWMSVAKAIPNTVESIAGPRPTMNVRGPWNAAVVGIARQAAGIDPYQEELRLLKEKQTGYSENVDLAKARENAIIKAKMDDIQWKVEDNNRTIQEQRQAYATLGERNPFLAKNPAYIVNLYPGWDADTKQKLLEMSVDPTTGAFKPGAPLWLNPEAVNNAKIWSYGNLLLKTGQAKTEDEAMRLGAEMSLDPAKYMEYMRKGADRIRTAIADRVATGANPKTDPELVRLLEVDKILNGHTAQMSKVQEYIDMRNSLIQERDAAKAGLRAKGIKTMDD
jgi:hypothetical protein